ncbi:MAG: membrane dipeptidase [Epulopiscium sp.]|jgi:membrane dipeptidase|nr:membrane dipeptidase [Candidatus Epulonipiscium sp.]
MIRFVDGHCDTIVKMADHGEDLWENQRHIDIKRLQEFGNPLQFFAIWLDPRHYPISLHKTMEYIDFYYQQLKLYEEYIAPVYSYEDIQKNDVCGKISALLSLEGGEALEGSLSILRMYYRLGVRAMTLTWNYRNALADGVLESETGGGLTKFGKEVVQEMNNLGMIVDVSHISEKGFWDVEKIAEQPYIASHSNAKAICPAARNLTDEQIKVIARRGGVIGINLYPPFLSEANHASMEDVLQHIDHIIELVGDDYIGLGSDFDGIEHTPFDICHVSDYSVLFQKIEARYSKDTMEKIGHRNFLRVLKKILK